jgi:hypothetical protein
LAATTRIAKNIESPHPRKLKDINIRRIYSPQMSNQRKSFISTEEFTSPEAGMRASYDPKLLKPVKKKAMPQKKKTLEHRPMQIEGYSEVAVK